MRKNKTVRIAAFVGSACLTVGLLGAAASATGAYFQDEESGTIQATIGSIDVRLSNVKLNFTELLPGESHNETVNFKNVGKSLQDVYIRFDAAELTRIEPFATIKVNGMSILTGDPVKVRDNLGAGGSSSAKITVALKSDVTWAEIEGAVDDPAATSIDFELIATQYNVGVDA